MILDANTTAKVIRHTIQNMKNRNPQYENDPARSILMAFEELAKSFDMIATSKMTTHLATSDAESSGLELSHRVVSRDTE